MGSNNFDFDSGDLALDFVNTKEWRHSENPTEKINNYTDFITWGEEAQLISPIEASQLRQVSQEHPAKAAAAYDAAIQLREAIYFIFSNRYHGKPIPAEALVLFNTVVRAANAQMQLVPVGDELLWEWAPGIEGANRILWPVARSAAELLPSAQVDRVRECEDDRGCGYLFIDQSKNRSRRWCSMDSCGNRAKARRHYARIQDVHLENIEQPEQ